jgi:DNA-binding CsgD family transcriptional regulator/PAS domain-containing protein
MKKLTLAETIRKQTESRADGMKQDTEPLSKINVREIVCELQVHQIELEMQNEELLKTQSILEETKSKFEDLYLNAPVGYLTLNSDMEVLETNLMALKLLGHSKETAIKKHFLCFIAPEHQGVVQQTLKVCYQENSIDNIKVHQHPLKEHFIDIKIINDNTGRASEWNFKVVLIDSSERNKMQDELDIKQNYLRQKSNELYNKNIALQELMGQIGLEKNRINETITFNAERLLLPLVKRLQNSTKRPDSKTLDLLERNIIKITSQFGLKISKELTALTNKEIEISKMIRAGFSSKDISISFDISIKTVETHRRNIRQKLGIKNGAVNLTTYLNSI